MWKGLERFKLGDTKAAFENKLTPIAGGVDLVSREVLYQYICNLASDSPIIFAGIRFSFAALTFNNTGKLTTVELHAFYWATDTSINKKDAEKHSKLVLAYLENQLGKGQKRNQKENTGWRISREYKWKKESQLLIFTQHIKKSKKSLQGASHFSVWLNSGK